eukprot:2626058-Rhodomonas_salina.1
MLGFSPRHRTRKVEEMSRWMRGLLQVIKKVESAVDDPQRDGEKLRHALCDSRNSDMDVASLQDIVDLLPLPVLSKLKQKVDAILYHLSMDQVGKAANENALQDDDDFDVHLLGDIFSNNSMDNFEKIINLLPAQVAARCGMKCLARATSRWSSSTRRTSSRSSALRYARCPRACHALPTRTFGPDLACVLSVGRDCRIRMSLKAR